MSNGTKRKVNICKIVSWSCTIENYTTAHSSKMAKKGSRVVVTLECTEARTSSDPKRSNGISRYTTEKNKRNTTERLELKKFNPHLNLN